MENILEEKANPNCPNIDIVFAGDCSEPLQKKAREFSEKVANGKHYMDLEVGFIRGYQSAIEKACEWLKENLQDYINDDWTSEPDFIKEFKKAMTE